MENIKSNLTRNLQTLRKASNLTQAELAIKLNYSDKAISKWERGESFPDIEILYRISKLYNVSIDDLISSKDILKIPKKITIPTKLMICLLSIVCCWVVATFTYVILSWTVSFENLWLVFIYAIPASSIIALVLNCVWGKKQLTCIISSVLLWTSVLSFYLTSSFANNSFIFIIAIPIQVAIFVVFLFLLIPKKNKMNHKNGE